LDKLLMRNVAIYATFLIIEMRLTIILLFAVASHFLQPGDSVHITFPVFPSTQRLALVAPENENNKERTNNKTGHNHPADNPLP
jgi:archaellum component FlaF (FlaF/FlaG flagellin family)